MPLPHSPLSPEVAQDPPPSPGRSCSMAPARSQLSSTPPAGSQLQDFARAVPCLKCSPARLVCSCLPEFSVCFTTSLSHCLSQDVNSSSRFPLQLAPRLTPPPQDTGQELWVIHTAFAKGWAQGQCWEIGPKRNRDRMMDLAYPGGQKRKFHSSL